jgi:hypothetical protein
MASFQQYFEYRFNILPTTTVYRFAELEINQFLHHVHPFVNSYRQQVITTLLVEVLFPTKAEQYEAEQNEFYQSIESRYYKPTKQELITYFLFHHQSYRKITALTGISPNTISKNKFQSAPIIHPVYKNWTPEMLHRWRAFRQTLNLWNEVLVHSIVNEQDPDTYEDTDFYEGLTRNPFDFHKNNQK